MKTFMPELPQEQRKQLLVENCDHHEETNYMRDLDQDEVNERMGDLSKNLIVISKQDDILDEHKETHKAATKPLKLQNAKLLDEIKNRKTEVEGTLYYMADHENGVMEVYDEKGEFQHSRRLRPDEKQARLFTVGKASNE
jgi:hypothetical protein